MTEPTATGVFLHQLSQNLARWSNWNMELFA